MKPLLGALAASCLLLSVQGAAAADAATCVGPGGWIDGRGRPTTDAAVLRQGANAPVVVLGESHENAEDHRWQLQTVAGLYALNPKLAIGMESFPRRLQPVLDRWSAGELDEAAFLKVTEWDRVWGYDPAYYLPIMHFARMRGLPLIALNVERSLVSRTAREGWASIPPAEREGVGDPAPASDAYRKRLTDVASGHGGKPDETKLNRFIEAQSLWDRAMAEAAAAAHRRDGRTVVAIMGRGHGEYRDGAVRQLEDLGLGGSLVWLTWAPPGRGGDGGCNASAVRIADAVFGVSPATPAARARLGVEAAPAENGGLKIVRVAPNSIAATAGLKPGDVVVSAAGKIVNRPGELTALVRAAPPGTWLPLEIRRGGRTRGLIAKFPQTE